MKKIVTLTLLLLGVICAGSAQNTTAQNQQAEFARLGELIDLHQRGDVCMIAYTREKAPKPLVDKLNTKSIGEQITLGKHAYVIVMVEGGTYHLVSEDTSLNYFIIATLLDDISLSQRQKGYYLKVEKVYR